MDLRVTSGSFFLLIGVILIAVGAIGSPAAPLTRINVDLYSGVSMVIFGGLLLWLSRKQPS
jgi:hypothetical protein